MRQEQTSIQILDNIPEETEVTDWFEYIPLGHSQYWQLPTTLTVLASLSYWFEKTENGWRKVSQTEYQNIRVQLYRDRFALLMTNPQALQ